MTCTPIKNGYLCNLTSEYEAYFCFEHTTYIMEFSKMFGPSFFRVECGETIEIETDFNDNNEPTSNKFLWDMFGEWHNNFIKFGS